MPNRRQIRKLLLLSNFFQRNFVCYSRYNRNCDQRSSLIVYSKVRLSVHLEYKCVKVNVLKGLKMGCELGKLAKSGNSTKNQKTEEAAALPVQVDTRLPLTAKQKYNMLASWRGISRAMESTGVTMFLK